MTASLRPFYSCGRSSPTNIESTCFQILSPSIWIIDACSYTCPYLLIPGQTQVLLHFGWWLMALKYLIIQLATVS